MERPETFRDTHPAATAIAESNLAADTASFARIIQRRNELGDKIRFGVIALNSGSLLAMAALMGTKDGTANWMNVDVSDARYSAAFFIVGMIGASLAPWLDHLKLIGETADAFTRMSLARDVSTLQATVVSDENAARRAATFEDYLAAPLVDFQSSMPAIWAQNVGVGGWLGGAFLIVGHLLGILR